MTLFVAICDDDKRVSAELEIFLTDIFDKLNIKYEIDVYFTGESLCEKMGNGTHYNLIFLDIEFAKNAINGIQVGRTIREAHRNHMAAIVYISWQMAYSMQLFAIRPFDFLIKPLDYKKIEPVVKAYVNIAGVWSGDFTYKSGHDNYKLQIKDIVYLQSVGRKIVLHLTDGRKEEFYGSLKEVYQDQLQGFDFIFIHSSYVVNYDHIAVVKYDKVILTSDATPLPISQPKRKEVREAYYEITERRRL